MKFAMSPFDAVLSKPAHPAETVRLLSYRFTASVARAVEKLDDSRLDKLPDSGVAVIDLADLSTARLGLNSVHVHCAVLDQAKLETLRAGNSHAVVPYLFRQLREWSLIDHHLRGLEFSSAVWESLTRDERVLCVTDFMHEVNGFGLVLATLGWVRSDEMPRASGRTPQRHQKWRRPAH